MADAETRQDYRVWVRVQFSIDVGARDAIDATTCAEAITQSVFRHEFSRADDVDVDITDIKAFEEIEASRGR